MWWSPSPIGHQVVTKWSVNSGCHKLSENIWFAWSNTCYKGEKVRCHACDTHTHGHVKVEQYSAEAESAKMKLGGGKPNWQCQDLGGACSRRVSLRRPVGRRLEMMIIFMIACNAFNVDISEQITARGDGNDIEDNDDYDDFGECL